MKQKLLFLLLFVLPRLIMGQIFFEDVSSFYGINQTTGFFTLGNGLSFADYDNDGWDDITLTSGSGEPLRFYKNYQGFFVEQNLLSPAINYPTRSVLWVDYDNDNDKDLFIASDTNGNRLYENTSNGFIDVTLSAGLPLDNLFTYGVSFGDIDNDGCLDLYLSNRTSGTTITNYLFKNNCNGTFTNVTDQIGLSNTPALTLCAGFIDINNDGWQDLYVANDKFFPNILYKNNGDGTFTDISLSSGTDLVLDAMSVTVEDFNNDGYLDIYITNTPNNFSTPSAGSVLLKNNGDETFSDISVSSGTQLDSFSWGSSFFDAENDGDLDLYVSCSYTVSDGYPSYAFYENQSDETFTSLDNVGFLNNDKASFASAIGDIDNDGKVDILVNNSNALPFLWKNQTNNTNNYLVVELKSTQSNKDAVGTLIEISINNNKQYRYVMLGESYLAQNSSKEFFGVGNAENIDYIKVKWLSGVEDVVYNIQPNQQVLIIEGDNLGIEDNIMNKIDLLPNPFQDRLFLTSRYIIDFIEIYDLSGKKILTQSNSSKSLELNLNFLTSGFYFIKVFSKGISYSQKLIKN